MRARNIKPGFFENEVLGQSDPFLSLLFAGLWCIADKAGRLEDRPVRIKAQVFPYREGLDINGYLTELERLGFIHRYEVGSAKLIQVLQFKKHQNPHHTERESELPEFTDGCEVTVREPLIHGDTPSDSLIPDSLIPDSCPPAGEPAKAEKRKREPKVRVLGGYPEELNLAMGVWRDLRKELLSEEILARFPNDPDGRYVAQVGTKGAAWEAWQKRRGMVTPEGVKVTDEHILAAVRLWAETRYKLAKAGKNLSMPNLSSLINSADFEDALLRVAAPEVAHAI